MYFSLFLICQEGQGDLDKDNLHKNVIYPIPYPKLVESQRKYHIPLRPSTSFLSPKIFKDLQRQLLEPWPFLVHIDSVVPIRNTDEINTIEIAKNRNHVTARFIY
jgi:hypothetical protein